MTRPDLQRLMPLLRRRERVILQHMASPVVSGGTTLVAIQRATGLHLRGIQQAVRALCLAGVLERHRSHPAALSPSVAGAP